MLPFHRRRSSILLAVCALAASANSAHAGPMIPCIDATLSANGSILVVNEMTLDDPNPSHPQHVTSSTLRVIQRYVDPNGSLRMNGPDTHFATNLWSVVSSNSDSSGMIGCPYTLVTDDGEYLVVVSGTPAFGDVLRIYRRRDHRGQPRGGPGPDHGVLIRSFPLSIFWSPEEMPTMVTDHTPAWFADGTFAFSADNRVLIHKTRWGKIFRISLETGQVADM